MQKSTIKIIIKVVLIFLFIGCLGDWEYGYYQFVRYIGMIGFLIIANYDKENKPKLTFWLSSAILINPIFKIALGRIIWNRVDVFWVIVLTFSTITEWKNKRKNTTANK